MVGICRCLAFGVLAVLVISPACFAAEEAKAPAGLGEPGPDRSVIYRLNPITGRFTPVVRKDIDAENVYYRYCQRLGKWAWSKATPTGELRMAMGPGSSQPAALFDLPTSNEERTKGFENQAPELAKRLAINGAKPSLVLGVNGKWTLAVDPNGGRVFDEESGQRWEWHGFRVTPVNHSGGNSWAYEGGRYVPVSPSYRFVIEPAYQ